MENKVMKIGKYEIRLEENGRVHDIQKYKVVLVDMDRCEIVRLYKCIGGQAFNDSQADAIQLTQRLRILSEKLEMARHNMRCYRNNEIFDQKYLEEEAEEEVLTKWIDELQGFQQVGNARQLQ